MPSENEGCPVVTELYTAAQVRQAYATVGRLANLPVGAPVIVRETPPEGRHLQLRICEYGPVGWTLLGQAQGSSLPFAAPAPLSVLDADKIAKDLTLATRGEDTPIDHTQLAQLLERISALPVDNADRVRSLHATKIVFASGGDDTDKNDRGEATLVVVDAHIELKVTP